MPFPVRAVRLSLGKQGLTPSRNKECLFRLYSRITFFFDNPRKAHSILRGIPEDCLKHIRGVHVSCHDYSAQDAEGFLPLGRENPCALHLCGMGNITDRVTKQTALPPSRITLWEWLLRVSQSLNAGVAVSQAERWDPELAEMIARRLGGVPQAEESSAGNSLCFQACTLIAGDHVSHRLCSTDDFHSQSWHDRCWLLRRNRRHAIQGKLVNEEYRSLISRRRRDLQAAVVAIEAMEI